MPTSTDRLAHLDPWSRQMATDLLTLFPAWQAHLHIVADAEDSGFTFDIPPPAGARGGSLQITSRVHDDITVIYADYHQHFDEVMDSGSGCTAALGFIQSLLTEKTAIVSWICQGDALIRDGVFASHCLPVAKLPQVNEEYPYASMLRIRSWAGAYDAEFAAPYVRR